MTKPTPRISHLSLAEVQSQFTAWRKNKKHRERIPEFLWSAAAQLCDQHSIHKISRALQLNHSDLSRRVAKREETQTVAATVAPAPSTDFVTIEVTPTCERECIVEMEHRNGNKMRIHFKGQSDLDLQSLTDTFWG